MAEPGQVDLSLAFKLPPRDALAYFRSKGYQITGNWWEMWQDAHAHAFTIAHASSLDILEDFRATFDEGLAKGLTKRQIVADLAPKLKAKGWWGRLPLADPETGEQIFKPDGTPETYLAGSPWRIANAWQTNKRVALQVGRNKAQLENTAARPYWMYVAVMDSRVRPSHAALNGRVYRYDDPIWAYLYPPNGWGCRCRVRALSERAVKRLGLKVYSSEGELEQIVQALGVDKITGEQLQVPGIRWKNPATGEEMVPDAGWAYNPGAAGWKAVQEQLAAKAAALAKESVGKAKAALLDLAKAEGSEALARAIAKAEAKAAEALKLSIAQAKALADAESKAAAAAAAKGLAQAEGERALAASQAKVAERAAQSQLDELAKTALGKKALKQIADAGQDLLGEPGSAAQKLGALKSEIAQIKKDIATKATLTNYEKWVLAGKKPTAAQKAALDSLSPADRDAFLAQLADKKAAKDAAEAAALQGAPAEAPQSAPLLFSDLEQIGGQGGSNPGGLFRHKQTGEQWYVKVPADADRARNEVLTAQLYRAAGVEAPEYAFLTVDGHLAGRQYSGAFGIASKIIDGVQTDAAALRAGTVSGVGEGFAADAWLANWDVVGLGYDNLLVKQGRAIRVDTGGGLLYRAHGAPKGAAFGPTVTELDTLRNSAINPQAASVFGQATEAQIRAGAARILAIPDTEIRRLVDRFGPEDLATRQALADTLIARKQDLAARFPDAVPSRASAAAAPARDLGLTDEERRRIRDARINGYSRPSDGPDIEDQNLLLWTERAADGSDLARAYLKVRASGKSAIEQSIRDAGLTAGPDDGGAYDSVLAAVKGVAYHHAQGGTLRAVDIERVRQAQTRLADRWRALLASDPSAATAFEAHYRPWLEALSRAIEPGEGQRANWSAPAGLLERWTPPPAAPREGVRPWRRLTGTFDAAQIRRGRATKTGAANYTTGYKYRTDLPDGSAIDYWPDAGDIPFALRGRVEVVAPGADPERPLAALAELGLDVARATPLDREELYLRRIAYHRRDGHREIEAGADAIADQAERVRYLRAELSRRIGTDITRSGRYRPDGDHQAFGQGRVHQYRPDLELDPGWLTFEAGYRLHHSITQGDLADSLERIIDGGGQMAPTADKLRRGIQIGGMSPDADLDTGGASYFFTRIKAKAAAAQTRGLVWRVRHVGRLDAISYDGDKFGRVTEGFVSANRKVGVEEWKAASRNGSNETILKDGLSIFDDLEAIVAGSESERAAIIAMLRRQGYERWPDGRAVEDIVRVAG